VITHFITKEPIHWWGEKEKGTGWKDGLTVIGERLLRPQVVEGVDRDCNELGSLLNKNLDKGGDSKRKRKMKWKNKNWIRYPTVYGKVRGGTQEACQRGENNSAQSRTKTTSS